MPAFDFPPPPAGQPIANQHITGPNGPLYRWDGTKWVALPGVSGGGAFLPLVGGTLTGPLTLSGNATAPLNPVPLQQLRAELAGQAIHTGDTPPPSPQPGDMWFDTTIGQLKSYIGGVWVTAQQQDVSGFLPLQGGTLTGSLYLSGSSRLLFPVRGLVTWNVRYDPATNASTYLSSGPAAGFAQDADGRILFMNYPPRNAGLPLDTPQIMVLSSDGNLSVPQGISCLSGMGQFQGPAPIIWMANTTMASSMGIWIGTPNVMHYGTVNNSTGQPINLYGYLGSDILTGGQGWKPSGGLWADSSDFRIKTVHGDYVKGLEAVKTLQPRHVQYLGNDTQEPPPEGERAPYSNSGHAAVARAHQPFVSFVAQEVEAAFPEMVTKREAYIDGTKVNDLRALDTSPLIYVLVNAVKELAQRVEALEAR